jgi:chemotaxis protein CheZ
LVDFSETNLTTQLTKIHDQVAAMVAVPAISARNSGMELEAVVLATEAAANQIMEAAEAIGDWLRNGKRDARALEIVAEKLNSIFEACTFQDVTGQRLRRAIQHLQQVETTLTALMPAGSAETLASEPDADPDLAQDAVDHLFDQAEVPGAMPCADPDLGQAAVDDMFGLTGTQPAAPAGSDLEQDAVDRMFG